MIIEVRVAIHIYENILTAKNKSKVLDYTYSRLNDRLLLPVFIRAYEYIFAMMCVAIYTVRT